MKTKTLTGRELEAIRQIRNYLIHTGKTPSIRKLMLSMGYSSPRSVAILIEQLINKRILTRKIDGKYKIIEDHDDTTMHAKTVDIPLVGTVACGAPVYAEENIEAMISVSTRLIHPGNKYFILRAKGDSMNKKGINDGSLLLVRQTTTAKNGESIVALIDNEATVKEFHFNKNFIILNPQSTNPVHKPIILTSDFQIQGVVVKTIPNM